MQHKKISRRSVLQGGAALAAAAALAGCGAKQTAASGAQFATSASSASHETKPDKEPLPTPDGLPMTQYRAMWVSYLDWALIDFSGEDAFRASAGAMLDNCKAMGLNTVIAQVRPFGDALYRSSLFPWSHLCTGTQGQDPGFDPLDVLVTECHDRALSLEAWVNPYRLRLNEKTPAAFADTSLAVTHPEWCVTVEQGMYLNPAIAEAADYVVQGVEEIVEGYAVDGVHFDDYFYPTTDAGVDASQYAASGSADDLDTWRRANVTRLVKNAHNAVKAKDPTLRFGISPQGNPDNNYSQQYSDVNAWISPECGDALVDYICPQLYWGYHYTLKSGSDRFAYENISAEWASLPRLDAGRLYFGLGAWRIGDGDGGANSDAVSQWNSGENLAAMIRDLKALEVDGYALFRYASLFDSAYPDVAAAECAAITTANAEETA